MKAPDEHESRSRFVHPTLIVLGLILLYVASQGPVLMLTHYRIDSGGPIDTFYQPLGFLVSKLPVKLANAYGDYLMWWLRAS